MIWLILATVVLVALYRMWPSPCPAFLHRADDGTYRLEPSGQVFADLNAFQKWWTSEWRFCPIPVVKGAAVPVETGPYATTPINKVDDYEFSRVFGYERNGKMEVPRQDFNRILNERAFDWPEKPLSSDERRDKYMGLVEGFTTAGALKSYVMAQPDPVQQYSGKETDVDAMVQQLYQSDIDYEPVVTKVGANHWEVNELRPRHRPSQVQNEVAMNVVDRSLIGDLPCESERHADPWYGPVPGMERMFGPTFDRASWT